MTTPSASDGFSAQTAQIPTEQLLVEVYASAAPAVQSDMVSKLVGKVYQTAPPDERGLLIRCLMQPLGILSLLAVANGVFAKIRLQGGLSGLSARLDEVQVDDVVELARFAQQVSEQAMDGLVQWLTSSPVVAGSAAAAILVQIFRRRSGQRRESDRYI